MFGNYPVSEILITGGTGVIGSLAARRLLERGQKPIVLDLSPDIRLIKDVASQLTIIKGDILDLPGLMAIIKNYRIGQIIHLASVIDPTMQMDPRRTCDVIINGTVQVLEAARLMDVKRVVFASTKGVYADITGEYAHPTYKLITEDYPKSSPNCTLYGAAKLFCERYGTSFSQKYGVEFITLRFAFTYSPGKQMRHGPLSVVSQIIENALAGKPTIVPRGGEQKEDFVYNKDVANAIVLACQAQELKHHTFHIGSGQGATLLDVASIVKRLIPGAAIEIGPGLDFIGMPLKSHCIFDISRAKSGLGYEPQYSLEAGIKDYIDTLRQLKYLESL